MTNWEQYVAPYFRRVFKVAKIMLHAHTHYYAAALGGKVTVLQSLVITPTLHLKSKIDKNTGPVKITMTLKKVIPNQSGLI